MTTFHIGFNPRIARREGGWQDRVMRPEAKEDDHASVLLRFAFASSLVDC